METKRNVKNTEKLCSIKKNYSLMHIHISYPEYFYLLIKMCVCVLSIHTRMLNLISYQFLWLPLF